MKALGYIARVFNLTLTDISKKLNVTPQTVNDWVKGKRSIPKERLNQLSKIFEIDVGLFNLEEIELTQSQRMEITLSYLKFSNELQYDKKYPYYTNDKDINKLAKKLEDTKMIEKIEGLIEGGTKLEDEDYSWRAVRNFQIFEKLTEILSDETSNLELIEEIVILLLGEQTLKAFSTADDLSELIRNGNFSND